MRFIVITGEVIILNETGIDKLRSIATKLRKQEKMQKSNYKSSLHYLALQPGHSELSFEEFLRYFSNKGYWEA